MKLYANIGFAIANLLTNIAVMFTQSTTNHYYRDSSCVKTQVNASSDEKSTKHSRRDVMPRGPFRPTPEPFIPNLWSWSTRPPRGVITRPRPYSLPPNRSFIPHNRVEICTNDLGICNVGIKIISCKDENVSKVGSLQHPKPIGREQRCNYLELGHKFSTYKLERVEVELRGECATKPSIVTRITTLFVYTLNIKYAFFCRTHCTLRNNPKTNVTLFMDRYWCIRGYFGPNCTTLCRCQDHKCYWNGSCNNVTCMKGYYGVTCQNLCPDGFFGPKCKKLCQCQDNKCYTNGTCIDVPCKRGYHGITCQDLCPNGYFGPKCRKKICQCQDNACYYFNGSCVPCKMGYYGIPCQRCKKFTYGKACKNKCSNCLQGCYPENGTCFENCPEGFVGEKCRTLVTVTVCPMGKWGSKCGPCGKCLHSVLCNSDNGSCPACQPNWDGSRCDRCETGKFGMRCCETCGRCREGCHSRTGLCFGKKCEDGYIGSSCKHHCALGWYGKQCGERCSKNCKDEYVCSHENGTCIGGCKVNYEGLKCETPTITGERCSTLGRTGTNCKSLCGHCIKTTCSRTTGDCVYGCLDGYKGKRCVERCAPGYYGPGCSEMCGYCKNDPTCAPNGTCLTGCEGKYIPPLCMDCTPGYFGELCDEPCGHCLGHKICDSRNGACENGCAPGFTGHHCQQRIEPLYSFGDDEF